MFQLKDGNSVVLATESQRRIDMLRTLGISFVIVPPHIDEARKKKESPKQYVLRMAVEKASKVGGLFPDKWVIGVDTVVCLQGRIFGKPEDEEDAVHMLQALRGRWHRVLSGFCILNMERGIQYKDIVQTEVFIKDLTDSEIIRYVKTQEPFGKAGSYALQGRGSYMVKKIRGSYANVIGLPICEIAEAFLSLGIVS
jgi:septum formation protein